MVTAIVLMRVERTRINAVAEALAELDGVSEVYSVSGEFDLVAILRVPDNDRLAELVTTHMLAIRGIERSETLLAFRTYSRHDLAGMFSIGFGETRS
jgi:DNA-binding Lrp family transcriptional regulator